MQFFTVATLFLATAFAAPSDSHGHGVARRQAAPNFCPPGLLYSNPQCCKVDVLGIADLDCVVPPESPKKCRSFGGICAKVARQPKCCAVPVAGQALLCVDPVNAFNSPR
ncbi:fungal hydrophobin domain-containing protein [Trichoderma evansii]